MEFALQLGHLESEIKKAEILLKKEDLVGVISLLTNVSNKIQEIISKGCTEKERCELQKRESKCRELLNKCSKAMPSALETVVVNQPGRQVNVEELIMPPDNDIFLGDIVGMEEAKLALVQAVLIPNAYNSPIPSDYQWRGILLFGPSGVGKSKVVRAFVNSLAKFTDIKLTFLNVTLDQVCGSYHGDTERNLSAVFKAAETKCPCILMFDEIDALCGSREKEKNESGIRITNHFLSVLDGLSPKSPIVVVGTTNKVYAMDSAFYRRFQKMIYVELPDRKDRERLLRRFVARLECRNTSIDIDFPLLASLTFRYSPADLATVVAEAAQGVVCGRVGADVLRFIEKQKKICFKNAANEKKASLVLCKILNEDMMRALRQIKPTNSESDIQKLDTFANLHCNRTIDLDEIPSDFELCSKEECLENPFSTLFHAATSVFAMMFGECM